MAEPVRHKSSAKIGQPDRAPVHADREGVLPVILRPNNGNPNGNPDGPTTLSGTGNSQFGGSSPGTSGYN